jgi:hypothetical protein
MVKSLFRLVTCPIIYNLIGKLRKELLKFLPWTPMARKLGIYEKNENLQG